MDPQKFCPGFTRPSETQTWYYPSNSTPQETTYCQFCVKLGCVPADNLITFSSNTCNCDCPHRHTHGTFLAVPFICKGCQTKDITLDSQEKCQICERVVPARDRCCDYCSSINKVCKLCGSLVHEETNIYDKYSYLAIIMRIGATSVSSKDGKDYWMLKQSNGSEIVVYVSESPKN